MINAEATAALFINPGEKIKKPKYDLVDSIQIDDAGDDSTSSDDDENSYSDDDDSTSSSSDSSSSSVESSDSEGENTNNNNNVKPKESSNKITNMFNNSNTNVFQPKILTQNALINQSGQKVSFLL
jgi:hypothetical protein